MSASDTGGRWRPTDLAAIARTGEIEVATAVPTGRCEPRGSSGSSGAIGRITAEPARATTLRLDPA